MICPLSFASGSFAASHKQPLRIRGALAAGLCLLGLTLSPNGFANTDDDLYAAAQVGELNVLKNLGSNDPNLNRINVHGDTLLTAAVRSGNGEAVHFLLSKGVSPNVIGSDGLTPLGRSAVDGHRRIANILIHNGADIEARDATGATAILQAARSGNINVVYLLARNHAKLDACDNANHGLRDIAAERKDVRDLFVSAGVSLPPCASSDASVASADKP